MVSIEIQLYQELISPFLMIFGIGMFLSFIGAWFTDEGCWGLMGMIVKGIKSQNTNKMTGGKIKWILINRQHYCKQ